MALANRLGLDALGMEKYRQRAEEPLALMVWADVLNADGHESRRG